MITTTDKDLGAEEIKKEFKKLSGGTVTTGIHTGAGRYTEGKNPPDVVDVAFWQEFGTSRIPETPFIRSAIDVNLPKINLLQDKLLNNVIFGRMTAKKALDSLGFFIQTRIQNRINTTSQWAEPLAPATASRKRRGGGIRGAVRLIQSGLLLRSITFESKV